VNLPSVSNSNILLPSNLAIRIEDLSISYKINVESKKTLKNAIMRASRGERVRTRTVEAVKNLSLDIPHGSVLGIVGANGAGKSTLMRSIAGILPPTSGQITVNGRISTLLALGVGFNKALSGRDNIILGGLAAGMSKAEIEGQADAIAEFADLPEGFTYSNGMYSRVAFAVAVNMTPDILLLDEALSAGDAAFKEKSFNRMRQLCDEARTILIVSHALSSLNELCDHAIWMHKGKMLASGEPEDITDQYLKFLNVGELPSSYEDL
jgi:lipopolysaccharide transport system ATP-binding protein/teichoic acid transport system ATP-binding protein